MNKSSVRSNALQAVHIGVSAVLAEACGPSLQLHSGMRLQTCPEFFPCALVGQGWMCRLGHSSLYRKGSAVEVDFQTLQKNVENRLKLRFQAQGSKLRFQAQVLSANITTKLTEMIKDRIVHLTEG